MATKGHEQNIEASCDIDRAALIIMLSMLQVTKEDVERCEESSELSPWFSAVNANDVSSVESMIEQHSDVNALEVRDILYSSCFSDLTFSSEFMRCDEVWREKSETVYFTDAELFI